MEKKRFFVKGATSVELPTSSAIKTAFWTSKAFYFQNTDGIGVRISNEGVRGWRIRSNQAGTAKFSEIGGAQLLSRYLGEENRDCDGRLQVTECDGGVRLLARDGSSVRISLENKPSLRFYSASGELKIEITELSTTADAYLLKGSLAPDEAVYGGGERLDVANKRGRKVRIFTCDGWNNSSTSYTVIPLFFTTRGGGMFINRYEIGLADFGATVADEWSYTLNAKSLDAYFYATEDPKDVLRGYTEISGHADMPKPWMQGVQICRYAPDFANFEKDLCCDSIKDYPDWETLFISEGDGYRSIKEVSEEACLAAERFFYAKEDGTYALAYVKDDEGKWFKTRGRLNPLGSSVKTIMTKYIEADLKPDAANMEGSNWPTAFLANGEEKMADLRKAVSWLHTHGLRAMVYMGLGRVRPDKRGMKDSYWVHADVEVKNADGTVERFENTTYIPWVMGTAENPDVGKGADGKMRSARYLDITNDEAVDWYFNEIWGEMIDIGIDGVKIDFCEILPDGDVPYGNTVTHYHWKNPEKLLSGTEHHAYPTFFISEFYKRMNRFKLEKGKTDGFMVFSRGGGIGSQRSPYMWAGDQARQYDKLDDQLLAVVTSGLSGIPFMSFDVSGYAYRGCNYHTIGREYESALFCRGVAFTAFFTNVESMGDVRHAYEMTPEAQSIYRNFMGLHKELIPYMQKYSRIACDTGMPPVRHPVLKYLKDTKVYDIIDEFLLGDALLVAPILTENTFEREVYLPAGKWKNLLTDETVEGGRTVSVKANLGQIPVFLEIDSPDAKELLPIFEGIWWNEIKHWK